MYQSQTTPSCIPQLKISRYDNDPLTPEDRMNSVFIDIGHRTSKPIGQNQGETNSDSPQDKMEDIKSYRRLTLPVPEDGIVHIEFQLRKQVEMLFIQVNRDAFHSAE